MRPLAYSRVLYDGGFRYRSLGGILGMLAAAGLGVAAVWCARLGMKTPAAAAAASLVALLILHVVFVIEGRRRSFSIETGGIVDGGRFIPWSGVSRFAAEGHCDSESVYLFYSTISRPAIPRYLMSERRISPVQYEELVATLQAHGVGRWYPHLDLGGYEGPST